MICKVCKSYYKAKKENRYEVIESKGVLSAIAAPAKVFEAFDCIYLLNAVTLIHAAYT